MGRGLVEVLFAYVDPSPPATLPAPPDFSDSALRLTDAAASLLRRVRATYADLFYEQSERQHVTLVCASARRARPPRWAAHQEHGLALRTLDGAEQRFAAAPGASPHTAARLVDAVAVGRSQMRALPPLTLGASAMPSEHRPQASQREMQALAQQAADAALGLGAEVARVEVRQTAQRTLIATTEGVARMKGVAFVGLRVEVRAAGSEAYAIGGGPGGMERFFAETPETIARRAVERAQRLNEARPLRAGALPVVFAGGWGGTWVHEAVGHLLEADVVAAGGSPFAGRLGEPVAAPALTLIDDPTLPGARGSYAFDDEGTPARPTTLIADGTLQGFLTDRRSAAGQGFLCTGNGRRAGYRHEPLPRMSNLILQAGSAAPADLIGAVADGLYVTATAGGHVIPATGRCMIHMIEGRRIERGRLTHPVADVTLTGRAAEVLRCVRGIAADAETDAARGTCEKGGQAVPISTTTPTVLVDGFRALERIPPAA